MSDFDLCMAAMDVAEGDADFGLLELAYRCGDGPAFAAARDRLLELGVEGVGLEYVMTQLYHSHPARVETA